MVQLTFLQGVGWLMEGVCVSASHPVSLMSADRGMVASCRSCLQCEAGLGRCSESHSKDPCPLSSVCLLQLADGKTYIKTTLSRRQRRFWEG